MKKLVILALAACMMVAMTACGTGATTTPTPTVEPTPTATPAPVDFVFTGPKESIGNVVNGLAATYMENTGLNIQWKRNTAGTAMAYTIADKTDIALLTRELREEELAIYDGLKSNLLCTEAIAIVAGKDCPVDNITMDQLRDIFNGEITSWADLGGSGDIAVYAMGSDASTGDAFKRLALGLDDTGTQVEIDETVCSVLESAADMGGIIADDPLTIGFMPLSLAKDYDVKVLSVDGTAATEANVKAGTYPLFRNYYMITVGEVPDKVQAFIDYCTTDSAAKDALKEQGFILP